MADLKSGQVLRVFVGECDKYEGMPTADWIVRRAKEEGMAGATVIRGCQGFGYRRLIRTAKLVDLMIDLPVIVEIVDTSDKIQAFMPLLDAAAIKEGLATVEEVQMRVYRKAKVAM